MNDSQISTLTNLGNVTNPITSPIMTSSTQGIDEIFSKPINNDVLQAMLGFLRRNGLTDTEELLSKEAMAVLKADITSSGLPPEEAISVEFDTFVKHSNVCTDVVQAEFSQLLFPVFAHSYISLVEMQSATARQFFDRFSKFLPECFSEYVYQFSLVEDPLTLRTCEHVQTLRENRFVARLSRPTMKHLELILPRLIGVRNILAKHVNIENTDQISKNRSTIDTQTGGILGQIGKNEKKQHKMFYAVVKDDLMQSIERRKMKGKEWRDAGKKTQNIAPVADRIPLPPLSENLREEKKNHQREVSKMAIISSDSPVSICMYTTLNAPIGVSSCDFSDDSNLIAMGMADSSIIVNAMDPMNKMKKLREMEYLEKIDIETAENIGEQMFDLQASTSSVRYTGHGASVFSVNFSPDRRILLSSSGDKTVRLWSMDIQKNVVIYRTPSVVWDAQFCNRGYYFATGSSDKTAALWCTDRMTPIRIFADSYGDVGTIDFHPNCNYVAGGSDDRYVRVWDVLTGTCVRTFSGHKANVIGVKCSPDGRYLISLDAIGNLMVWDMAYQRLVAAEITEHHGTKGSIAFSRDGGVFAVSHGLSNIAIYSLDALIANMAINAQNDAHLEPKINMEGFNLGTYPTKQTSVIGLHFTRRNLLMGFGCYGQ